MALTGTPEQLRELTRDLGTEVLAYACRLMGARKVVPIHYGTFPALTGTPEQLRELTRDLGTEVLAMKPGETLTL